ncbi:DUF4199 domain-containing protein [Ascidiimonas sp. W6]|uniref:DUF4199 domain-containing protein n=1 Tax=Ascidiimonas meishanensis TaxID=3128903 RepID=UPI0030ECAC8B
MKKTILKFGLYSGLSGLILFTLALVLGKQLSFSSQEVIGYASIVTSLLFVFFAIKHYRDQENNGAVTFSKALLIGILISLFASIAFGIVDAIYIKYINPDFPQQYASYTLENLEKTVSVEEFKLQKEQLEASMEIYANPLVAGFIMFATVFIIGVIISILSAFILKRN